MVTGLAVATALTACAAQDDSEPPSQGQEELAAREARLHDACSAPETYVRLKELVFDQAARLRRGDAGVLDEAAATATVALKEPVTATGDPNGVVVCSGRLLLEMPDPGGGDPRRLAAEIEFAAQAANDGTGLVFEMEGADTLVRDLAALGGPTTPQPPAAPAARADMPLDAVHRARHSTGPSFDCAAVDLPAEQMICASRPLSQLDREMASLYYDQMARAEERQRDLLRRTRDAFLARRNRCRDAGCIASVYEDRIEEIRGMGRSS